ncbi:hypothetical protein BU16DRAFT_524797 [Lophium mytilinum]|uniref:Uncharacterized protein n=1 Tax=Lophium mytilinum TaxID=390894 RepID=A0A6A6R1Z0_9PEZI|nr:hypothetical protein BU16DRAFT_524797 [Lophium mytilinum]
MDLLPFPDPFQSRHLTLESSNYQTTPLVQRPSVFRAERSSREAHPSKANFHSGTKENPSAAGI